jgi:hypothetical protein
MLRSSGEFRSSWIVGIQGLCIPQCEQRSILNSNVRPICYIEMRTNIQLPFLAALFLRTETEEYYVVTDSESVEVEGWA